MEQKSRILSTQPIILEEQLMKPLGFPLEESVFAKNANSEAVKTRWIESFKFINSAHPFYIPVEQHVMIPSQLEFKDREYWGNAIHFLLSNKAHGFPMWKQFQEQVRSMDATVTCRPHISAEKTNLILKHLQGSSASEKDSSIKDFLVNKMILVQLPFQPALLFQWLTSATYRISVFEVEQYIFSNFPFPAKFRPLVERLQKAFTEVHVNIGFLFDYLQHQVERGNDIFVGNLQLFGKVLKKVIDGITIFFSPEAVTFSKYITGKTLAESWPDERLCKLKKKAMPLKERNFVFNLNFWKALPSKVLKIFGSSEEKLVRKTIAIPKKLTSFQVSTILKFFYKTEHINLFDLDHFMLNHEFIEILNKLDQSKCDFSSLFFKSEDKGSVGDILVANAYSSLQIAQLEMACWINKHSEIAIGGLLNPVLSDLDDSDITDLVSTISVIEKEPLSIQMMLNGLKDSWLKSIQQKKSDYSNHDDQDTVKLQQKKILEIILNCMIENLEMKNFEKEKDEKLRDWQVAQFLLPCFVASYNNICKANPPIDEDMKVWYAKFIHNLISAYEGRDGIRKSSWKNIKKDIDENSVLKDDAKLLVFIENVIESFNNKIKQFPSQIGAFVKFCPIWDSLYEVLSMKNSGSSQNEDVSSEPSIYWNWLMWDFFSKMKHAISISG